MDLNFGVFETGRRLEWTYMMAADMRRKAEDPTGPHTAAVATQRWDEVERGKYIWWLPLSTIPGEVFSTLNDQWIGDRPQRRNAAHARGCMCAGIYHAMRRVADGHPDSETGACTSVSTAIHFEAVPAFVIRPQLAMAD